jgi:negative regulator of flagellin synthesis FlgM
MTDPISNLGRAAIQVNPGADKINSNKASNAAQPAVEKAPVQPATDEVILSEAAESALADTAFDSAKVDRIKQAIQEGNYPLDAKRIAESFLSLERMIGGK